jgi:hypothetical protein
MATPADTPAKGARAENGGKTEKKGRNLKVILSSSLPVIPGRRQAGPENAPMTNALQERPLPSSSLDELLSC